MSKTDAREGVTFYRRLHGAAPPFDTIGRNGPIVERPLELRVRRPEPHRPDRPERGRRVAVVVRLLLPPVVRLLCPAAAARRDGRAGRRCKPSLALFRHLRGHGGSGASFRLGGGASAAP